MLHLLCNSAFEALLLIRRLPDAAATKEGINFGADFVRLFWRPLLAGSSYRTWHHRVIFAHLRPNLPGTLGAQRGPATCRKQISISLLCSLLYLMSRPSALRDTLRLPSTQTLEVVTVLASGDCFYDCIEKLLTLQFSKCGASFFASMPPLLRSCNSTTNGEADCGPSEIQIPSSQSMRNYVADQLTTEQLDLYQMYSTAGLHEYNFATGQTLEDLRLFAKKSGRTNGPGKCFWADEFALRKISDGLHLTLLIIDDQATRGASVGGAGMGRKRRRNDDNDEQAASSTDNRFVFIGTYPRAVILHRSRRQHYNAVVIDGNAITELEQLPLAVRSLWRVKGNAEENEAGSAKPPSKSDEGKQMNDNEKVKDCVLEEGGNEMLTHHQDLDQNVKQLHAVGRKNDSSTAQSTRSSPTQQTTLGNFYCGCAGFSSSSWVGNFYPKSLVGHNSDRQLDHYQQHFRTVEINSTFYGIPSESTVSKWAKVFANSFKVVVKAPKALTHEQSQLDCSVLSTFLARMKPLNDTLAVILIQCPRTLDVNVSSLQQIKHVLDEEEAMWYNGGIAFEFRNEATYFDEGVRRFLKQNSFALVMHPNSVGDQPSAQVLAEEETATC